MDKMNTLIYQKAYPKPQFHGPKLKESITSDMPLFIGNLANNIPGSNHYKLTFWLLLSVYVPLIKNTLPVRIFIFSTGWLIIKKKTNTFFLTHRLSIGTQKDYQLYVIDFKWKTSSLLF